MTPRQLLLRNLMYHWRGNLAVFLGVTVGTAVLTGALFVGDSLRGSLRRLALRRLGWIEQALVAPRFIREEVANQLGVYSIAPAILLQGTVRAATPAAGTGTPRGLRATVVGLNDSFFTAGTVPMARSALERLTLWQTEQEVAVLNAVLARELGVRNGDVIVLQVQRQALIPRESLLGRREAEDVVEEIPLRVHEVVGENEWPGEFSLSPSIVQPHNVFVPLRTLQARLKRPGRINAILAGEGTGLQERLRANLTLDDWDLVLHSPSSRVAMLFEKLDRNRDGRLARSEWRRRVAESFAKAADANGDSVLDRDEVERFYLRQRPYLALESRQVLIEPVIAAAASKAAERANLRPGPTLVYLANEMTDGRGKIPYSVVAALDPTLSPPLGPFLPPGVEQLAEDEIVLVDWKDSPLQARPGDRLTLTYFSPQEQGQLREEQATFRLRGFVPLQGAASDADLTPEFPGITDKLDLREWNPPFPFDNRRVQKRDEQYWEEYRTVPKAYVTLAAGQRLWGSRFGDLTSLRLAPAAGQDLAQAAEWFQTALCEELQPEMGGLVFEAVRQRALEASQGGVDFGVLFLGFSCFLIAAALLLVGLLVRLNVERRAAELGLLLAVGFTPGKVQRLLLREGGLLSVAGAALGCLLGVFYTAALLAWLRRSWPGGLEPTVLRLYATPTSLLVGFGVMVAASLLTVAWAVRVLKRLPARALLEGETASVATATVRGPDRSNWVAVGAAVAAFALILVGAFVQYAAAKAGCFFGAGALLLVAGLASIAAWLRRPLRRPVVGNGLVALARLGARNAARHPVRSLLTAGLLAAATFLIVAVIAFHREVAYDPLDEASPSGGFNLLAESELPLFQPPTTEQGQEELNIPDRVRPLLAGVTWIGLRLRAGDDASCLNLYQPGRPRLLGVPQGLIDRGGFHFKATTAQTDAERSNPWRLLERAAGDYTIPVFGEANTVEYLLKSRLGGEITVPDGRGTPVQLRIVGLLHDSVFQGELLMSEANFLRLYPRQEGYRFFLLRTPAGKAEAVKRAVEDALASQGVVVTATADRLRGYLAVENMYLAMFQALGGLGLVLGSLGLAVVLLRGVWERRSELALLRSVGYQPLHLGWLVLSENALLLVLGLLAGTGTALLAVAPQLWHASGAIPWPRLAGLLAFVIVVGLGAGAAAMAASLRAPLLSALRRE